MNNSTWTPPPPIYPYAPPRGARSSQIVGRSFALLFAPFPMIWGGVFASAAFGGWVGFFIGFIAIAVLLGCAMGSTHAPASRRAAATGYAFSCLAWGGIAFATIWAILSSITFGGSC